MESLWDLVWEHTQTHYDDCCCTCCVMGCDHEVMAPYDDAGDHLTHGAFIPLLFPRPSGPTDSLDDLPF